jgi:ParB-like chromosome segregation protein Spo0J
MKQHKQMMMKVSELKNLEKNARKHSPAQLQQIEESIKKFGFLSPIVIDKNNVVQAGNGRLMAATKLGMTEVPCIQANGLSKDELRAFALVDNRLSETSEWDKEILKLELEDLTLNLDFDLGPIGFSSEEIESLLRENEPLPFTPNLSDDDDTPNVLTHKLVVECDDDELKQELFDELKSRGFKVKAG